MGPDEDGGVELVVIEGEGAGSHHALNGSQVLLGRLDPDIPSAHNRISFPDATVSSLHAELEWNFEKRQYLLIHRSQTNFTVLNGTQMVGPRLIGPGDRFKMGRLLVEMRALPKVVADPGEVVRPKPPRTVADPAKPVGFWVRAAQQEARPAVPQIQADEMTPAEPLRLELPIPPPEQPAAALPTEKFEAELERPEEALPTRIGRNHPCSCGSGKKYKRCCGRSESLKA